MKYVDELVKGDIITVEFGDYDNWVTAEVVEIKFINKDTYEHEIIVRNLNCDYNYSMFGLGRDKVRVRNN